MVSSSVTRRDASIKVIPRDILSMKDHLGVLDLAGNALTSIDEIGGFKALKLLDVSRNALTYLPASLCDIFTLVEVRASKNKIVEMRGDVHLLTNLKVLDLSDNALHVLPTDVGWLQLDTLNLFGNPDLRIPTIVTQMASGDSGIKAVLSYLQVIGEQQRMVEEHLEQFSSPAPPHAKQLAADAALTPAALAALLDQKQAEVAETGVLDLKQCGSPALLGALHRAALPEVTVADVRYNGWTELPKQIMELDGVVVCNASHNNISVVTIDTACTNLSILNLSFNKVSKMPTSLGNAPNLEQLYLANNNLTDLPEGYSKLPLVDLFLSENPLTAIPRAVLGLSLLSKLSMACCQLTNIPPQLARIKTLRFLDVSFNMITDLDASLAGLEELSALNMAFNPLKKFPEVILSFHVLVECNLDYTGISTLPSGLGALAHLEGLQLEGCPLVAPLNMVYAAQPALVLQLHHPGVQELDLSGLLLDCVPPQIGHLASLTTLNLSKNLIESVPEGLSALSGLSLLDLSGNKLTALPEDLGQHCSKVQVLKLHTNALVSLPESLSRLTSLKALALADNRLTGLPASLFSGCSALLELNVSGNRLAELPHTIGSLTRLKKLLAHQNRLTWVPAELAALQLLEEVSFDGNLFPKTSGGLRGSTAATVQVVLQALLAAVGRRQGEQLPNNAVPPTAPEPPSSTVSKDPIPGAEDPSALRRTLSAKRRALEAHLHRLSLDPVRRAAAAAASHTAIASHSIDGTAAKLALKIPHVVSYMTVNHPAPPHVPAAAPSNGGGGAAAGSAPTNRPQTMARFKRLMVQSEKAKHMLTQVDNALSQPAPPAAADK